MNSYSLQKIKVNKIKKCQKNSKKKIIKLFSLKISAKTWLRNKYDLIDYDSSILVKESLNIKNSQYIYREYNDIYSKSELISNDGDIEKLMRINVHQNELDTFFELERNKYGVDETDNIVTQNSSWFVLKPSMTDERMNKYKLNAGEIIKIGRITMRIRDIVFEGRNKYNSNISYILNDSINQNKYVKEMQTLKTDGGGITLLLGINKKNHKFRNVKKTFEKLETNVEKKEKFNVIKKNDLKKNLELYSRIEKKNKTCRICFIPEEDEVNNPLVQPCNCDGSLKYIHLQCLSQWIYTHSCEKLEINNKCSIYLIKPVVCELCKTKFPDYIKFKNKFFPLINFTNEYNSYLTLESLTLDKYQNKFIYVVSIEENRKIPIGKHHDCEIVLSDRSIDMVHCFMTINNKQVYLEDNDSKFGTLVLVQTKRIKLYQGTPLYLQIGRSFLEILVKKEFKLFDCCVSEDKFNIYSYYEQNEKYIQKDMPLVVKDEDNESESFSKNNNTEEVKLYDFENNSLSIGENDKMSDNEYLQIKRNKRNKNIKKKISDLALEQKEETQKELISNNDKESKSNKNVNNQKDETSQEIKIENESEDNKNENNEIEKNEDKVINKNENNNSDIINLENKNESKIIENNKIEKSLNNDINSMYEDNKIENIQDIVSNDIVDNEMNNNILKDNDEINEINKENELIELNKSKDSEAKVDVSAMEI